MLLMSLKVDKYRGHEFNRRFELTDVDNNNVDGLN